jgi:hypothetical protein
MCTCGRRPTWRIKNDARGEMSKGFLKPPTEVSCEEIFWRHRPIFCPRSNCLRRGFQQQLVEADRTSVLVVSTTCPLHQPYLLTPTMSYWVGLGDNHCWCWSRTDCSTVRCRRTAGKTDSLTSGDSYHHSPTESLVQRTRGGGVLHSHRPKSSHSQQSSRAEEGVATATSQVMIRA